MKKNHYLKEMTIPATQKRGGSNLRSQVRKIQSWLTLFERNNIGSGTATNIDGDFGPATQSTGQSIREKIIDISHLHLNQRPQELVIRGETNSGPWVRSYMDGNDGARWFWCVGFVQTIIDQAVSEMGGNYLKYMPKSYSCDTMGMTAKSNDMLIRSAKWRSNPGMVKPGDIFLRRKSYYDWDHTGIIVSIDGSTIDTIEGNTNDDGSRNGYGVFKRVRNFQSSSIDVFSIANIEANLH